MLKIRLLITLLFIIFLANSCSSSENGDEQGDIILIDEDVTQCNYTSTDDKVTSSSRVLKFSSVYGSFSGSKFLRIKNSCYKCDAAAGLTINKIEIVQKGTGFKIVEGAVYPAEPITLKKDDEIAVGIVYEVVSWEKYEAVLRVHSNDKCFPIYEIPLEGVVKATARIRVDTPDDSEPEDYLLDFGESIKEEIINKLVITNEGVSALYIRNLNINVGESFDKNQSGFFIDTEVLPNTTVSAKESKVVNIGCRNSVEFPQMLIGEIEIMSNDISGDSDRTSIKVKLQCGKEQPDAPQAVLSCSPKPPEELPVLKWGKMNGEASYDPGGSALTYYWTFESVPGGSSSGGALIYNQEDMTESIGNNWTGASKATFQAMLPGDYHVRLMVKNDKGIQSNWAQCLIKSAQKDDLRIQLIWDNRESDLDLHLISPEGSFGNKQSDCFYYNCSPQYTGERPDWGVLDDSDDDPSLDIDNTTGMGPEAVFINNPANGTYKVVVHSYKNPEVIGKSSAFLKVYSYGHQVDLSTMKLEKTDQCWDAFTIDVTDGAEGKKNISVSKIEPAALYDCTLPGGFK